MTQQFPNLLKQWRTKRHFSQLQLALEADVSARHISFLESGRAKPSKEMVHQLARSLKMPKPDTNQALLSAGFAPVFQLHRPDNKDVAQINLAVATILKNHMPLPAIVLDRHWNITAWNGAGKMLLNVVGFVEGGNLVELTLSPQMRQVIENWAEVIVLLLHRLEVEYCDSGGDAILGGLLEKLRARMLRDGIDPSAVDYSQAVMPTQLRLGETRLSIFSALAQFGTVFDTQLGDLRIELMFPLDPETQAFFEQMAADSSGGEGIKLECGAQGKLE